MQLANVVHSARWFGREIAAVYRGDGFKESYEPKPTGMITSFGTWALLLYIGLTHTQSPSFVFHELLNFFTGSADSVVRDKTTFLQMLPIIFLVVAIELPLCLLGGYIGALIAGPERGKHAVREMMQKLQGQSIFRRLFLGVFLEETGFRWFAIGLLTGFSFFTLGHWWFYTLLIVSNVVFALVHLSNYKEMQDRNPARTIPQFIGGLMFSFVFVKFGFVASVLAHFASNAVIFSYYKLQRTNGIDLLMITLHGLLALISWNLMERPLSDATIWFSGEEMFALVGWTMRDYVLFTLFISSCFNLVADLLLYDKNLEIKKEKKEENSESISSHPFLFVFILLFAIGIGVAIPYITYFVLGFVFDDVPLRILICALIFVAMTKNYSLSSAQRAFWVGLPNAYLSICIITALGFWGACWYACIMTVIGLPHMIIKQYDD